jgi:drug/metabolite transporter (DMT)-like permease
MPVLDAKLLGLLTAVFFGLVPVMLQLAFRRGGTPGTGMIVGLVVAVPANLVVLLLARPDLAALTPFAVAMFALAGLVGSGVGRRLSYNAIHLIGPSRVSTLWTASPVSTALLAAVLYAEPVTPVRWAAIGAIALGGGLVSWTPGAGRRGWLSVGVVYALGAAFLFGLRPLLLKAGLLEADLPVAASTIGATAALAYALVMEDLSKLRITRLDAALALFLVAGILQTASQLALTVGLASGDVSVVYTLTAASPLLTLGFTALLLRGVDEITPRLVAGALVTVAGVIVL